MRCVAPAAERDAKLDLPRQVAAGLFSAKGIAEGSKFQIPRIKAQRVLTADCTDSTDENQCGFVFRRIRIVRVRNFLKFES